MTESANWLLARDRVEQAQRAAKKLLFRKPQYPASIVHFIALPAQIFAMSEAQIQNIK